MGANPVILIVEDEPLVRMTASATLEDEGFDVAEAGDADEALRVLQARSDIRLIFTDIDLPGELDGLSLASHVCVTRPEIEIIVTSGHHRLSPAAVPDDGDFLPKPYSPNDLVALVREKIT